MGRSHTLTLGGNFEDKGWAATVLRYYYRPLSGSNTGYTGGAWDTFDPAGDRDQTPNEFTTNDLASAALLSAPIGGRATVELLDRQRDRFTTLLREVPADVDLLGVDIDGDEMEALVALFHAVRSLHGVGLTRATKLLARKRPRLAPIVDGIVKHTVFNGGHNYWTPLHEALRADKRELWDYLNEAHNEAGLDPKVTPLRVFDVLAWMDGVDHSRKALAWARDAGQGQED